MFLDFFKSLFLCKFRKYFKIKRKLGEGSFGKVYLVSRKKDSQYLAVKAITKSRVSHITHTASGDVVPLEVYCLNGLRHPHIVSVHGYLDSTFHWLLVMEYCPTSVDMFEFLALRGTLSEELSRDMFLQLHSAVSYCISVGVDHRDIKDENILVNTTNNTIKLIDFGCASLLSEKTPYTSARGTSICLPPEYHQAGTYFPLDATVWAFGCLLFKMLQGYHPFQNFLEITTYQPDVHGISMECKDILSMCLTKNPKQRIAFASIVAHPWCSDELFD